MRLINIDTLEMRDFTDPPPYAILSHRWSNEELLFQDFPRIRRLDTIGSRKVIEFCQLVARDWSGKPQLQVQWVWIDTCCIDKTSSAELSEAINSMWKWYGQAAYCVAFLANVYVGSKCKTHPASFLKDSEWFERGWTLQELLAPEIVVFCDVRWTVMGQKRDTEFMLAIQDITSIQRRYLARPGKISQASVARRMSWVSRRKTTRAEDVAYSLTGLFNVNMPLLYGEGSRAFQRLQEEIIKQTFDESIFAWTSQAGDDYSEQPLLAPSPRAFANSGDVLCSSFCERVPYGITNQGLQVRADAVIVQEDEIWPRSLYSNGWYIIQLNCAQGRYLEEDAPQEEFEVRVARPCLLALKEIDRGVFVRGRASSLNLRGLEGKAVPGEVVKDMTFLVAVKEEQMTRKGRPKRLQVVNEGDSSELSDLLFGAPRFVHGTKQPGATSMMLNLKLREE